MPQLDGKHYSYDSKGYAQYAKAKKKKGEKGGRKRKRKQPSTLRGSIMGGGY